MPPLPSLTLALGRSILAEPDKTVLPKSTVFDESRIIDTYEELCRFIASLKEEAMGYPGLHMSYSNESWALLGKVVERVSGMKYEDYVREHILGPLEMRSSGFYEDLPRFGEVTKIYQKWGGPEKKDVVAAPVWWEAPSMIACGFLKCTVRDLLRYAELFRTRDGILSAGSVDRIMGLHTRYGPVSYYGYGLSTQPNYHGVSLVGHSGGLKGISAHLYIVPEKGITVAVLCNLSNVPSGNVALAAINTLLGLPVTSRAVEYPDYECPAWRLPRYVGNYVSGEGGRFNIVIEGDKLLVDDEKEKNPLRPCGVDLFILKDRETETACRFLTHPSGEVWAVEMGSRIIKRIA
jgi:CubicO group peptidase (beta-lactamase class C family)